VCFFIRRRNLNGSFNNDVRSGLEHGLPTLTQSIATSINRKHCRPVLQFDCPIIVSRTRIMTGAVPTPPELNNTAPCFHKITHSIVECPSVDQSEGTTEVTVLVLRPSCMCLLADNRAAATVQIRKNSAYEFEEMFSNDLIYSPKD
jgi:hypothetical protein